MTLPGLDKLVRHGVMAEMLLAKARRARWTRPPHMGRSGPSLGMVTAPDCQAHRTAPTRRLGRCRGYAGLRARNTALPGTAASELASYGSWAQRTTSTGRWA